MLERSESNFESKHRKLILIQFGFKFWSQMAISFWFYVGAAKREANPIKAKFKSNFQFVFVNLMRLFWSQGWVNYELCKAIRVQLNVQTVEAHLTVQKSIDDKECSW